MTSDETTLDRALHAIADPTRRRILHALKAEAKSGNRAGAGGAALCVINTWVSIAVIVLVQLNYAIAPRWGKRKG